MKKRGEKCKCNSLVVGRCSSCFVYTLKGSSSKDTPSSELYSWPNEHDGLAWLCCRCWREYSQHSILLYSLVLCPHSVFFWQKGAGKTKRNAPSAFYKMILTYHCFRVKDTPLIYVRYFALFFNLEQQKASPLGTL